MMNAMALVADFVLATMRGQMEALTPDQRVETLEALINAFARLGVEHIPASEVAKMLREKAGAIENG
jgi:hypothetical protein